MMEAHTPFFSVIIPTYNRSHAVVKAVESVLEQTYVNFEVIVVDDGSTDDTAAALQKLTSQDVRVVYVFQENQERSAARNNGINHAKGEYVCFLDSDDVYEAEHLLLLKETIAQKGHEAALYHVHGVLKSDTDAIPITSPAHHPEENKLEYVLTLAVIPTSFVCVSQSILREHKFNTDLYVGEDRELWSRIVATYPIVLSDQFTVVQNDLGDRTVAITNLKTAKENLRTSQYIITNLGAKLTQPVRRKMLSAAYFKLAQSYLVNKKRASAIVFTVRAVTVHQDEYTSSLIVFLIQAMGLGFLLPSRFKLG